MPNYSIPAYALRTGDVLTGSGARIHRVIQDGLFERNGDDSRSRRPFPKGKVEVLVSYPQDRRGNMVHVRYWGRRTIVGIVREERDTIASLYTTQHALDSAGE